MKAQLYKGDFKRTFQQDPMGARSALARLQSDVCDLDPLTQMLYIDTRANLPDDLEDAYPIGRLQLGMF